MRIGLCLSGGGFRASLFHLGVFKRLHEIGVLKRLGFVSACSGGAITAALFQMYVRTRSQGEIDYDWEAFERHLLRITGKGVLVQFIASFLLIAGVLTAGVLAVVSLAVPLPWLTWVVCALLLSNVVTYAWLAIYAGRSKAKADMNWAKRYDIGGSRFEAYWQLHFVFSAPFSPSQMRLACLNTEFDGAPFGQLSDAPLLYLTAVDLISGRQMVFSQKVLAELSDGGADALWEQHAKDLHEAGYLELDSDELSFKCSYDIKTLPVAMGVAASSAFPPIFAPVTIGNERLFLGSFVDGGVLDNIAINTSVQLAFSVSARRARYDANVTRPLAPPFSDFVTHMLVAEASGRTKRPRQIVQSRFGIVRRIIDLILGHQDVEAVRKVRLAKVESGVSISRISLSVGMPDGLPISDPGWAKRLTRVRTHLDAFDPVETACLVYSGYTWANEWATLNFPKEDLISKPISDITCILPGRQIRSRTAAKFLRRLRWSESLFSLERAGSCLLASLLPWVRH